jgi:hypothetical protein
LYILSVSGPLCRALNTLQALTAADAQRSTALRLQPGTMAMVLRSDPDEIDVFDDDASIPVDAESAAAAGALPTGDMIPLQAFSIYGYFCSRVYSFAPFIQYLGRVAPLLAEIRLSRTTADTATELMTMRGPCRAVALRDIRGLTDTIVASILQQHRATLRRFLVEDISLQRPEAMYDPIAYAAVLRDKIAPQGAPFTKISSAALQQCHWSDEQRTYFSLLFPGLCDPRMVSMYPSLE